MEKISIFDEDTVTYPNGDKFRKSPYKRNWYEAVFDFYRKPKDGEKLQYNTTCIYILFPIYADNTIDGEKVYKAKISWYDAHNRSSTSIEDKRFEFLDIQLGLDLENITSDKYRYLRAFFTQFLRKDRVELFLKNGLLERPKRKSGIYIGDFIWNESTGHFERQFRDEVGVLSHNYNSARRYSYREALKEAGNKNDVDLQDILRA